MSLDIRIAARMDGVWCGDAAGNKVEIFDPRWWRVDRWVYWFFTRRPKGTLTLTARGQGVPDYDFDVRCLRVTVQPRKFKLPKR